MKVKKRTLLLIAGSVWLIAGFNVARIGIVEYKDYLSLKNILLSITVFALFGMMFYKMSNKHTLRIRNYEQEFQNIFSFFDVKSYCIMIFMMSGGIWLRYSGICPMLFIAVFYTGLGLALGLAGILFVVNFARYKIIIQREKERAGNINLI